MTTKNCINAEMPKAPIRKQLTYCVLMILDRLEFTDTNFITRTSVSVLNA